MLYNVMIPIMCIPLTPSEKFKIQVFCPFQFFPFPSGQISVYSPPPTVFLMGLKLTRPSLLSVQAPALALSQLQWLCQLSSATDTTGGNNNIDFAGPAKISSCCFFSFIKGQGDIFSPQPESTAQQIVWRYHMVCQIHALGQLMVGHILLRFTNVGSDQLHQPQCSEQRVTPLIQ